MNAEEFFATPANLVVVREIVLRILREMAPEEEEVTESYVDPLIDLAARGELPTVDLAGGAGRFGAAADWLLLPIVSAVVGVLESRMRAGAPPAARELWERVEETEIRPLVLRTKSARARKVVERLTRSITTAFTRHLVAFTGSAERSGAREERYTDISCPERVWQGTPRFHVVVRLTQEPRPWSGAAQAVELDLEAQIVQVSLAAPTFEFLNAARQEISLLPGEDSTPAVFDMRPRELGHQRLFVELFQAGHPLGAVGVTVEVTKQPVLEVQARVASAGLCVGSEIPPPQRVLRIAWHQERSSLAVSLLQAGGSSWQDFAPFPMRDPAAYAELLFRGLDVQASDLAPAASAKVVEERLKRAGQNLWRLLPEKIRSMYAREREAWRDTSLLLYGDEPHLPWELIWPYGEGWEDPAPWCLTLRLSRWLRQDEQGNGNPGAPDSLPLTALACVTPEDSGLSACSKEAASLRRLLERRGVRVVGPQQPSLEGVMDLLRSQTYDWLHVSAHGSFETESPDLLSSLWLEERDAMTPQHLVGPEIEDHLRRVRPAFFFNACQTGRLGWSLTGMGGWAARLIAGGARMFLGPLAIVEDEAALLMAESLYAALLAGETLAEATRQARRVVRQAGDPTWSTYSLYGHPNAKLELKSPIGSAG